MADSPEVLMMFVVLQSVLLAGVTIGLFFAGVFVARRLGWKADYSLVHLGLARPRDGFPVGLGLGVIVGFGAFVMSVIVGVISAVTLRSLGYSAENAAQEPLMRALSDWMSSSPALAIPTAYLVVAIIGPAVEELVFRGAIFGGLYRLATSLLGKPLGAETGETNIAWLPFAIAAILSSAAFAVLHLSPVIIVGIFLLAVILCALYSYTESLIPTIAAHTTFNSITVTILLIASFA